MNNKIFRSDKTYNFQTDLFLLENGKLLEKVFNEDEKRWMQYIINEHELHMEAAANKTISLQEGVLLKTFLGLIEPYIFMYNIICSGWLKPVFKEYKQNREKKIKKTTSIKHLEVYKAVDFSLHQSSKNNYSKLKADFDIHTGFHGIGKKIINDKDGKQHNERYSFSMSSLASIDHFPLKINTILDGGVVLTHYSYSSGKLKFKKTEDDFYELISEKKNENHRYFYEIQPILSKELSTEFKHDISFPGISINFTLAEVLRAIVYDMTFFGIGKERENQNQEIAKRVKEIDELYNKKKENIEEGQKD
ncbi:MAG: hypothetical protein A2096_05430 [Spirochaetes bacterium GWF1_41_5]|nr:MAG: hypothetical protein A2096_05430 [Spirochaetes bacterium GWF1_41_5]HBE04683.1 hypothetical protein [Spirochaetia bacterium]